MLKNILVNIGLNEKEAVTYLSCLELGPATASKITAKSGLNRVTTYDVLEKLIQKGFLNFFTKQGTKYFNATDPEIIVDDTKRKALDLQKALPDLKRLNGDTVHPNVRYFEGLKGIKAIYADTLNSQTEILNYANSREVREHWPNYDEEYVQERLKRKIYLRGIAPRDQHGLKVQTENLKYFREIRLVPGDQFTFTNEINIYDDKVAIISFKDELIGMIIQSQAIADTQRDIFKMAWEFAGGK